MERAIDEAKEELYRARKSLIAYWKATNRALCKRNALVRVNNALCLIIASYKPLNAKYGHCSELDNGAFHTKVAISHIKADLIDKAKCDVEMAMEEIKNL